MDWVYRFIQEVYRNPNDRKTPRSDFYAGQTAMMLWGSEGFSFVWDYDPDFPLGVGTRPKLPESNYLGANYQTWNYAISATTQHPEAAFELLKWLTIREESAGWFMRMQGRPSPVRALNSHPDYAEINPYVPVLAQILENVAPLGLLPVNDDIGIPLRNAFRSVLAGETSAASALSAAAPVSQAVLDEFWASYDATQ